MRDSAKFETGPQALNDGVPEIVELAEAISSYRADICSTASMNGQLIVSQAATIARAESMENFAAAAEPVRVFARIPRPVTLITASALLMIALSGVAIAADGAVPGDPLYPLDMNLEQLGIGDGGEAERIAESEILMARGDEDGAMTLLGEYLEILDSAGNTEAINKVERHLELALTKSNPRATAAQEKVAELKAFIEANKGQGIGLDGKEFGQGVAEIARSKVKPADPGEPADKTTGPPDNAGPKKDKSNTPEQAGPKDRDQGKPDK